MLGVSDHLLILTPTFIIEPINIFLYKVMISTDYFENTQRNVFLIFLKSYEMHDILYFV